MNKKYDFQYIVIGSGPAGSTAATTLAKAKKSVGLIEDRFFGGSDLNTLNVPYSVALDFSHTYSKVNNFPELKNHTPSVNLPTLISREAQTAIKAGADNQKLLEESSAVCFRGFFFSFFLGIGNCQAYQSDGADAVIHFFQQLFG